VTAEMAGRCPWRRKVKEGVSVVDALEYDVFISYARKDNETGWVSGLRDAIYDDFKEFSSEPFRIFFDTEAIRGRQDWELRLRHGLRTSRVLLVCLSPNYLRSEYCKWEWEEFARLQARRRGGGDAVTGVYFVALGGDEHYDEQIAAWRRQVERVQLEPLQRWFPQGVQALQEAEVRQQIKTLGQGVHEQLAQARQAKQAPGNLRRHNPGFVGRVVELRKLRFQLTGGAVGVVTAVHGIGGMGKTELAVTYAHAYAHTYQGGTWQVDADGHTDMLEAVSQLAHTPELGLEVREEQLADRQWLGRRVLARLAELTAAAREQDEGSAACLLLLDNVSEPELLSASQLGVLPEEPWLHLTATTRLGLSDIGAAGARASVAMVEVGRLDTEDGLTLIRDHQPARDPAKLRPDFSTPQEDDAARQIVELLDGYTLAVEQAAVYLGTSGTEPAQLLGQLRAQGAALLDEVGQSPAGRQAILHKEKIATRIADQTLDRFPTRARAALALASLLPSDTIPWDWLQRLTEHFADQPEDRPPGRYGGAEWAVIRRLLEGRRLLTPADDPRFARLHRVLGDHIKQRLATADTGRRLDAHLQWVSEDLLEARPPDVALLSVTAATLTGRLTDGHDQLADAAQRLIDQVQNRLDFTTAHNLATATLNATERLAAADPANNRYQSDLSVSLLLVADLLDRRGEVGAALDHCTRSLQIRERLAGADPGDPQRQRDLSVSLDKLGDLRRTWGDVGAALEHYTRSLHIRERLAGADPANRHYQRDVSVSLLLVGDLLAGRGEVGAALEHYARSLEIVERLAAADPHNAQCQRDVSVNLVRAGLLLSGRGEVGAALEHYARSLEIVERLAVADPDNALYQRELSVNLERMGDLLAGRGDAGAALEHHNRALQIIERLASTNPDNVRYQRELSVNLVKVGFLLEGRGERGVALEHYTRALQIGEWLAVADPANPEYQRDVSVILDRMADLLAPRGEVAVALEHYTRSLHIRERLADADPANPQYQRDVSVSLLAVANLLARRGERGAALEHYTRALRVGERLAGADPANPQYQRDVSVSCDKVGSVLADRGEVDAALEHYTRSLRIRERLAGADPANPQYQRDVSFSRNKVRDLLARRGEVRGPQEHRADPHESAPLPANTDRVAFMQVEKFDAHMVERYLREKGYSGTFNPDNQCTLELDASDGAPDHSVLLEIRADSVFGITMLSRLLLYPAAMRERLEQFTLSWNSTNRWPKASVFVLGEQLTVTGADNYPFGAGVHQELLASIIDLNLAAGKYMLAQLVTQVGG
jgi:tetratricopeptide (TPR) repeat protein